MTEKYLSDVFERAKEKGWTFFYMGSSETEIKLKNLQNSVPKTALEQDKLYLLLPGKTGLCNAAEARDLMKKRNIFLEITIPDNGFEKYGKKMFNIGKGTIPASIYPGEEIKQIAGITFTDKKVLLRVPEDPEQIYDDFYRAEVPYDVFIATLSTLQDISML